MNQDLFGALKNAVERGTTVERAVQSFLNAGYNSQEVHEAAQALTSGATALIQDPQKKPQQSQTTPTPQQSQETTQDQPKKGKLSLFNKSTLPQPSPELQAQMPQTQQLQAPSTTTNPGMPPQAPQQAPQAAQEQHVKPQGKKVGKKTAVILITVFIVLIVALILTMVFADQLAGLF